MLQIATSADFMNHIVEPDYQDAMHHRESLRHAFHLAVSLLSLRDWVLKEFSERPEWKFAKGAGAFQGDLEHICPEFSLISQVANSTKHLTLDGKRPRSINGAHDVRLSGGSGMLGFGALGSGPIGSIPTIEVDVGHDRLPFLHLAEKVVFMWRKLFSEQRWG
jgi:hypothetical protein